MLGYALYWAILVQYVATITNTFALCFPSISIVYPIISLQLLQMFSRYIRQLSHEIESQGL